MRNLINVLMIVVMVVFVGNVCADIIDIPVEVPAETPSSGGSGGGGKGGINTSAHEWIDFGGLEMNCNYNNNHPDTSFNASTYLDQGAFGLYWVYKNMYQNLYKSSHELGVIYVSMDTRYLGWSNPEDLPIVGRPDYSQSFSINIPGLDVSLSTQIENQTEWFKDPANPDHWYPMETDGLYARHHAWIQDAEIIKQDLNLYFDDHEHNELSVNYYFSAKLIGDSNWIQAITSGFEEAPVYMEEALAIPEPMTIALLGFGGLLFRRKKTS